MSCILLADGSRVHADKLIGNGADGFIILQGKHDLKVPHLLGRLRPDGKLDAHVDNELHFKHLEVEEEVYKRLRGVPGIANCIECTDNGILLEYYPKGSLGEYISCHEPPSISWRWNWILQATDIIARCHDKGILVFDIALRNFLLADDFSLRLIDFANSAPLPEGKDITLADNDGCTAKLDLLHLSSIIYSIMTWQRFSVRCDSDTNWPNPNQMSDLDGIICGQVIRNCWTRTYSTIHELVLDTQLCAKTSTPERRFQGCTHPAAFLQGIPLPIVYTSCVARLCIELSELPAGSHQGVGSVG
jgi:serine/threonine protein kinase